MTAQIECLSISRAGKKRILQWIEFSAGLTGTPPFCAAPTWISWLQIYHPEDSCVFELRDGSQIAALLPLYREGKALRMATQPHLDYQDILSSSDDAAVTLLQAAIRQTHKEGQNVVFEKVAEYTRLFAALHDSRIQKAFTIKNYYQNICPTVTYRLDGKPAVYDNLSRRQRKDHRTSKKRLDSKFPDHSIRHYTGKKVTENILNQFAGLHIAEFTEKYGSSLFSDQSFIQFLLMQAENGPALKLSALWRGKDEQDPLAFNIGYFGNDTYYYYLTAYDTEQSELSPGRYLIVETLDNFAPHICGDSLRFDMLSGYEAYKARWATSFYKTFCCHISSRRFANLPKSTIDSTLHTARSGKKLRQLARSFENLAKLEHEDARPME